MTLAYTFRELLSVPEDVLVEQMIKSKDDKGNIIIESIDDPDLASAADQDVVREKILAASEKARAIFYLDPSQLFSRLTEVQGTERSSQGDEEATEDAHILRRPTKTPPPSIEKRDDELMGFVDLVRLGGRPACNLDTLQAAREDPLSHAEVLKPWQLEPDSEILPGCDVRLFSKQLSRWKAFRVWQYSSRGSDLPPELDSYRQSQLLNQDTSLVPNATVPGKRQAKEQYESVILSKCVEAETQNNVSGLSNYGAAAQARLQRYHIHRPFSPQIDPRSQAKVDTWLEYIAFEVWLLDTHTAALDSPDPLLKDASKSTSGSGRPLPTGSSSQQQYSDQTRASSTVNTKPERLIPQLQSIQEIIQLEIARSQRVVNWTLGELHKIDAKALQRKETSVSSAPTTTSAKKRKRSPETTGQSTSPSTITPASSFRQEARSDDKKRLRTECELKRDVNRDKSPEPLQGPSPATSPASIGSDSGQEKE